MTTDPSDDPDRGLDVDARFAEIVAGWEPSSPEAADGADGVRETGEPDRADAAKEPPAAEEPRPEAPPAERLRGLFQPSWNDPLDSEATWEDEGHFVPPPPPPLPSLQSIEPRRRLAWFALVGSPLVALLLVGAGIGITGWMGFLLVVAFVGGFSYLVATMRSGPPGGYSGDDGARI